MTRLGYIVQAMADAYFNRPAWRSISLHKRQIYSHDTSAEAVKF